MKITRYFVPERLRPYIHAVTVIEGRHPAPLVSRTIPHGYFEVTFNLGDPFAIAGNTENLYFLQQGKGILWGQLMQSWQYGLPPNTKLLEVKIHPWAIAAFTNYPVSELIEQAIAPEFVFGKEISELHLLDMPDDAAALGQVLDFFQNSLLLSGPFFKRSVLQQSCIDIFRHNGFVAIQSIKDRLKVSRRTIELQFQSRLGITATQFARKTRLRYVAATLANARPISFTSLAHECGYFDQSHFIRDFKAVTRQAPKSFFSENLCVDCFFEE